jgi:hypothetical protein
MHWSYEGADGPQTWGRLKPEFNVCAIGRRQSPINIEEATTLRGPAEPLQFAYGPSSGSVVNNGHTIQVDVVGENTLTVRDTPFKLVQFHVHHPSEERVNHRSFAMVAHLVHRSAEGQLAVLAVLLDPGEANNLIHKVWTHMPLDSGDRVRMPAGSLNLNELLPQDQRKGQHDRDAHHHDAASIARGVHINRTQQGRAFGAGRRTRQHRGQRGFGRGFTASDHTFPCFCCGLRGAGFCTIALVGRVKVLAP